MNDRCQIDNPFHYIALDLYILAVSLTEIGLEYYIEPIQAEMGMHLGYFCSIKPLCVKSERNILISTMIRVV